MSEEAEVLFSRVGSAGLITLNRPKALNALTLNMVRLIHPQLRTWADDPAIKLVMIEGAGEKGFCAGGDIRALHDWGKAGDRNVYDFYREEYHLNTFIKRYPKPYVALMDGITMGGGVGMSVHGSHRVATERLVFAMPETGIGLIPDVGGTYFLPRLPGELGMYLALTGERFKAADAIYAGIADVFVAGDQIEALKQALGSGDAIADTLARFAQDAGEAPIAAMQEQIDRHFSAQTLKAVLSSLRYDVSDWAQKMAQLIEAKSPTCAMVAFAQLRLGATLEFEDCMAVDFRLTSRCMQGHDFYEGVRAVIIDKDQAPAWVPATIDEVSQTQVDAYFASLGEDELRLK
ncbi:MAG: enoyl-CoA hydratase/isomerase family protein [Rhizobiales bacterium]|nr:enoyl-CoA hydratase/isomerase family protein [Hyphomicrobiales bacterium]